MNTSLPMKDRFELPEGVIYLDGNSLGPLPKAVAHHLNTVVTDQWGEMLIKGWNEAAWMQQPARVGDMIANLIGAPSGSVMMGETLSIKVYQALAAALKMRPERRVVLSDSGNFPTDLYMAKGLLETLDKDYELRIVEPEDVAGAIDDTIAAVMLTEVDYRTGRIHDMKTITDEAHLAGAVMIWDLAHSAGALPVDLTAANCEFAVGCTYKYLNGGPGAPAFIYVRPDLVEKVEPALAGWLGHQSPFAFDLEYTPSMSIERLRVGTPPVLQLSALETALQMWEGVELGEVRRASIALSQLFIAEVEKRCPQFELAGPRDPQMRGSQVSFAFENGYAVMQALIANDVIGDFRAPDLMRFGFTPLYLDEADILQAVDRLQHIMNEGVWKDPAFHRKNAVT